MSIITNTTTPAQTRLYISPLSPSLLATVVPPSALNSVANVSYHTLENFPEQRYGYIELPTDDAQRLRKKLNGAFLKGMKVRVEEARPDKKRKARNDDLETAASEVGEVKGTEERAQKKTKREKRKDGVLPAVELPEGREVKRGWVQPEEKKKSKGKAGKEEKKAKSEKSEMLFRTNLPPNVVSKTSTKTDGKKEKTGKENKERRKGKGKAGKEVEVKEFSKSTKYPTFLRNNQVSKEGSQASEYVDGVGWVDGDGNVVETVNTRSTRQKVPSPEPEIPTTTAEVESSSSEDEQAEEPEEPDTEMKTAQEDSEVQAMEEVSFPQATELDETNTAPVASAPSTHNSKDDSSTASNLPAASTEATPTPELPREVHPLEALFKRPAPSRSNTPNLIMKPTPTRPAPIVTSFSFFGNDNESEEADESVELIPPQTPFTQRDLQYRGQRSAAPTPDTAAVGKKMGAPWSKGQVEDEGEDEDENDADADAATEDEVADSSIVIGQPENAVAGLLGESGAATKEQTEFEKHFWEHRGEYNRGWKARKREARKGVRQSENRRGGVGRGV